MKVAFKDWDTGISGEVDATALQIVAITLRGEQQGRDFSVHATSRQIRRLNKRLNKWEGGGYI